MKRLQAFIMSLYLTLTSCGAAGRPAPPREPGFRSTDFIISVENRDKLDLAYRSTNVVLNKAISRTNPNWQTEKLLPQISSWFQIGRGLSSIQKLSNDVSLYLLAPLPEKLLAALKVSLGSIDTRLAVLRFSFWQKIAKAQQSGLQVGFMASSSQIEALGVYYNTNKVIGLSSVSEENTLDHELRHHEQYKLLDREVELVAIDQSCISNASTAFGEIDATEIELPSYLGVENYMDRWLPMAGTAIDPSIFTHGTHSEPDLLTINLEYPDTVSRKVATNDSCPQELRQVMEKLASYFSSARDELRNALTAAGTTVCRIDTDERAFMRGNCNLQSSPLCQRIAGRIEASRASYAGAKQVFRDRLKKEISERRTLISNLVRELSEPIRNDLCHHAIGFAKLNNCEEER